MISEYQRKILWPEIKTGIQTIWGRLSDEELEATRGEANSIIELVRGKYLEDESAISRKLNVLWESFDNPTDLGLDPDVSSYHRRPQSSEEHGLGGGEA